MKKIPLSEFLKLKPKQMWDDDLTKEWSDKNFYLKMMDIYGEANNVVRLYKSNEENIVKQFSNLHNLCNIMVLDERIDKGTKDELRTAEWEILDFCLWDNLFHNDEKSVMKWFNQWCYDINYDLLY